MELMETLEILDSWWSEGLAGQGADIGIGNLRFLVIRRTWMAKMLTMVRVELWTLWKHRKSSIPGGPIEVAGQGANAGKISNLDLIETLQILDSWWSEEGGWPGCKRW